MNNFIITSLITINNTYQSIVAFFYQNISQTQYVNNDLATYTIDYTLLLPASQYANNLNVNQVNAQVQEYINLCNTLITYITTNLSTQTIMIYEQIQNTLNNSIVQLNGFSSGLLEAEYQNLFTYVVPYSMSLSNALFLNNISLDTYYTQIQLNNTIDDFNNIIQNTTLSLSRG